MKKRSNYRGGQMPINWIEAEETLLLLARRQLATFRQSDEREDVYGFGFFCDSYQGSVCLVANTNSFHHRAFQEYIAEFGSREGHEDETTFRWDIGNWKYPAGLVADGFNAGWEKFETALKDATFAGAGDDQDQERLERMAATILACLVEEGAFAHACTLEGFIILGPDDPRQSVLVKKSKFDNLVSSTRSATK